MASSVSSSPAHPHSFLNALGDRPDPSLVSHAKLALTLIDSDLAHHLYTLHSSSCIPYQDEEENKLRAEAELKKLPYKSIIHLNEVHQIYEDLQNNKETTIVKTLEVLNSFASRNHLAEGACQDVAGLVLEALQKRSDKLDLSGRYILSLPSSFGKLSTVVSLDLSCNQLKELPDSIASLINLEVLDLHSNELSSLPQCIGLLQGLRCLDISGNMLKSLPESICSCSFLVELVADFNQLERLPTKIGHELVYLQKLSLHSNKVTFFPASICELKSLKILDLHFNKLLSLPEAIGKLEYLEKLNLSNNFSTFGGSLPESIGDLISLKELDLSFNQITVLPDSIGGLKDLLVLKVDNNPLVIPPLEIVEHSMEAVKEYMKERWRKLHKYNSSKQLIIPHRHNNTRRLSRTARLCILMGFPWLLRSVFFKCSGGRICSSTEPPSQRMLTWSEEIQLNETF